LVKSLNSHRLLALFFLAWLLFNFPLLGVWDVDATVGGVPVFPVAIFTLWALLIGVAAYLVEQPETGAQDD
jgi:hypothetical protein